ncbi:MAG: NADH-quinone oxidoreductase subunit H [Rhodospirillales bacterium]|nr:NADH-quinone oxidoreductase subunit H [Rhodospirillales bacterium]
MSWLFQLLQAALVLAAAPLLTGFVRVLKARLLGRRGPPLLQPYRDLLRLLRKDPVIADNASWLFRSAPYLGFALIWLGACLVPTFTSRMGLGATADFIALMGILAAARFVTTLAGLDVGTAFGGIGSSRDIMIGALAEPAVLMVIFTISLLTHTTSLPLISEFMQTGAVGLRVSLALALIALVMVAIAENARIPVDNPATHLELTMVHEAMVLEYSGRHLALIDATAMLKLVLYVSLIAAIFVPFGMATGAGSAGAIALGLATWVGKLAAGGALLAVFETSIAKMRVFRVSEFLGGALLLGLLATLYLYVTRAL